MLLKFCTQYARTYGKLSSGHRTGKGQLSFQSQRKATPTNVWTTAQLHSFNMLAKWRSKFSKLGFNNTWTKNFHMLKLDLENTEEPEIKLPTSTGSLIKLESSRKTSSFALLTMPKLLTVWITTSCGKFFKRWEYHLTCLLRNLYAGQEVTVRIRHGTDWFTIGKGARQACLYTACILSPCLFNL